MVSGFEGGLVNLVAIHAAKMIDRVRAADPMPKFFTLSVATEANTVCFHRRALAKRDDLSYITSAFHMQAAGSVAILAFHALLRVKGMPEIFAHRFVTAGAGI